MRTFKLLGLECNYFKGFERPWYLFTPGCAQRLTATKFKYILKAAIKYRLGFKEWYK